MSFVFDRRARAQVYGELVPDPDGILDLPAGFSYRVLQERFEPMSDEYRVPALPDGMAAFPGLADDTWILMRNHEIEDQAIIAGVPVIGEAPPESYDSRMWGGVTRVVVDARTLAVRSSNRVLIGTARNCAGGISPWGWLSCEEDTGPATETSPAHGYVFLCPTDAESLRMPEPIPAYGRFNHEAAVVDPITHVAYLTEDRGDSALYRFVPDDPAEPFAGRLQAMRVVGSPGLDLGAGHEVGAAWAIDWVDLEDTEPVDDTLRLEARAKGAAIVHRGEGIDLRDGIVYVCSTNGGPTQGGQIFRLTPGGADAETDMLELVAQSEDRAVLDMPDNITIAPWGHVFMAEDGDGEQLIRGLTPEGEVYDFARNALSEGEMAGVCFSPDGRVMFVNLQSDGLTLAIYGDFPAGTFEPEPLPDGGVPAPPDAGPSDAGAPRPADAAADGSDEAGAGGCSAAGSAGGGVTGALAAAALGLASRRRETDEER